VLPPQIFTIRIRDCHHFICDT